MNISCPSSWRDWRICSCQWCRWLRAVSTAAGGDVSYDISLPWGGHGSPCGNLSYQRRMAERHAEDPRNLPGVFVDFPDLADCVECDMCGGCYTHGICVTDWNHITWFARFASPGEDACGMTIPRTGRPCALPMNHGGEWHQDRGGSGLAVSTANCEAAGDAMTCPSCRGSGQQWYQARDGEYVQAACDTCGDGRVGSVGTGTCR